MEDASRRLSRPLILAGAGAVLLAGGVGWLWIERVPIAASYIDEALRARNVPASYRLAHIGVRTHRIEAIRIGDPRAPDLTADWAEIELAIGLSGVSVHAVRMPDRQRAGGADRGLLVSSIAPDSAADRAGLLIGDVLVRIGEQPLSTVDDLQDAIASAAPGSVVPLSALRGGTAVTTDVTLGTRATS